MSDEYVKRLKELDDRECANVLYRIVGIYVAIEDEQFFEKLDKAIKDGEKNAY